MSTAIASAKDPSAQSAAHGNGQTGALSVVPAPDDMTEGLRGAERIAAIEKLIGLPSDDPVMRGLPDAVRAETSRYWDLYVEPLIDEHWPEVRDTKFYAKFKIGAQKVYAPAPYTVVVLSKKRPLAVRVMNVVTRTFRLSTRIIIKGLATLLPWYTSKRMRKENRRIVIMAAFIALVDEAFDSHLDDVPLAERGPLLQGILDGDIEPPTQSFALVQAFRFALDEGTTAEESAELRRAMTGCVAWGEAEIRRFQGEPDEEGLCHRGVGIRTGIDGLAWTVRDYITESEWQWMYDVSHFIQLLDDWIDLEKDLEEGVRTPVAEGHWTLQDVEKHFAETIDRIAEVAKENGETYEPYLQLARDSYRFQVQDLLQNMAHGIAD
ncbi:MAG: hypothetical protein GY822_22905 [Deltaproteobacteria bacterium]|nr:hypothetical protein [Deltaproteobacteria bacterium]